MPLALKKRRYGLDGVLGPQFVPGIEQMALDLTFGQPKLYRYLLGDQAPSGEAHDLNIGAVH